MRSGQIDRDDVGQLAYFQGADLVVQLERASAADGMITYGS